VSQAEDVAKPGDTIEVRVKEVDPVRKRISLSMVGLSSDSNSGEGEGAETGAAGYGADDAPDQEPEAPMPTVVELALRKALGGSDEPGEGDEVEEAAGEAEGGRRSDRRATGQRKSGGRSKGADMTEMYTRMIEDYRKSRPAEDGEPADA